MRWLRGLSADRRHISGGALETASLKLGMVTLGIMPRSTFATAIGVIIALNQIFYCTALRRTFRATSDDPLTASQMGINPGHILAQATGIAMVEVTRAALRDKTVTATSVGVDAGRMTWLVFLAASFGTCLTGALIYAQTARITPDAAISVTNWTAYVIFIVVMGGIGTIEGTFEGRIGVGG